MPLSETGYSQRSHFTLFLIHHPTAASIFPPSSFNKRYTFPTESMNGQGRKDLIGSFLKCKHPYHASALAEDAVPFKMSTERSRPMYFIAKMWYTSETRSSPRLLRMLIDYVLPLGIFLLLPSGI